MKNKRLIGSCLKLNRYLLFLKYYFMHQFGIKFFLSFDKAYLDKKNTPNTICIWGIRRNFNTLIYRTGSRQSGRFEFHIRFFPILDEFSRFFGVFNRRKEISRLRKVTEKVFIRELSVLRTFYKHHSASLC